jgi:hypothetical protein
METVAVLTTRPAVYRTLLAGRDDVAVLELDDPPRLPALDYATVVLEGIDDLEEPLEFLRTIAIVAPAIRILALVANAAFAPSLDAFISGGVLARGHAFVLGELAPLFEAARFQSVSIAPIMGGALGTDALPIDVSTGNVKIRVEAADVRERLQTAAYLVIAQQ